MITLQNKLMKQQVEKKIIIGKEAFQCAEPLFQPHLLKLEGRKGVHEMVIDCIQKKLDLNLREKMFQNIVLSGGNTMWKTITNDEKEHPSLQLRLQRELADCPLAKNLTVNVKAHPERKYGAWVGGSMITARSSFKKSWITIEEYKESGPDILKTKRYI